MAQHRPTGQRVIEVKKHGIADFFDLLHRTRVLALAVGRRKLHHIAYAVFFIGVAQFIEQLARHPLQQLRVALAKSLACGQLKGGARAFGQAQQALLDGR